MGYVKLEAVLEQVSAWSMQDLRYELKTLLAIRDWGIKQTGFAVGDKVVISASMPCDGGWSCYREALQGGIATIQRIGFSEYHGHWYADVQLDREWSAHSRGDVREPSMIRFWNGPAAETPDGYEIPSAFDQEKYPAGRKHTFMIYVDELSPAGSDG